MNKTIAINIEEPPPLSLYVHFPWCTKKCPYCDFNSHQLSDRTLPESQYLTALLADFSSSVELIKGRTIASIFFGGGTPSLISGVGIQKIISEIYRQVSVDKNAEITLEANPGVSEILQLKRFREAGVNRLSVGVQSFSDANLKRLGRIHTGKDALKAIEKANDIFDNVNIDIMYGLPEQSLENLSEDISILVRTNVKHCSVYQLTIEPQTLFYRHRPDTPDDESCWAMEKLIKEMMALYGYDQYEISAYAKNGFESVHNNNYWKFGDYLGIGAGAHSKISFGNRVIRMEKAKSPQTYMNKAGDGNALAGCYQVPHHDLPGEFMMNALRLKDGFKLDLFSQRTGLDLDYVMPSIQKAKDNNLVIVKKNSLRPTDYGYAFLNSLIGYFI